MFEGLKCGLLDIEGFGKFESFEGFGNFVKGI